MRIRKGEPVKGLAFYHLLYDDDDFCAELGRATLAAQRLESALKQLLHFHATDIDTTQATLGRLINFAESKQLLTQMLQPLKMLRDQRNYLTHNIHALFLGLVEKTVLERDELLDSDVDAFTERAWQLKDNLNGLAEIIEGDIHNRSSTTVSHSVNAS
jgi:hypothetical protein